MGSWLDTAEMDLTSEMVGVPLAIVLLALAFVVLPAAERKRARQGAVLLVLSFVCGLARFLFPVHAEVRRPLLFLATFFLLPSMGRSVVLVLVRVLLQRKQHRPSPRIFRDLSTGVVYLLVGLVAMRSIGVEPGSILTTSALLTAVVGLS